MSKPITAAELLAKLEADPEYLRRRDEKDAELAAKAARWRVEEAPLLADLRLVGWNVDSAWDLVNTRTPYPEAIPVLLDHLRRPYSDRVRDGIARALAVPDARHAWPSLVAEYRAAPLDSEVKDGLAIAVAQTSSNAVLEQLITLAFDRSLGGSRLFLLRPLRRSRQPTAKLALAELADDPELAKEIASWRKRKRTRSEH
ncbi:MAG: hypothetical protein QOH47_2288 [Sphingomonadales bacterium]|jgi:hypothetical protein|nr:hypothetical protein [Sphingomonadales bacterium]